MTCLWSCPECRLTSAPSDTGPITLLAETHDRLHHGGARTAQLVPAPRSAR